MSGIDVFSFWLDLKRTTEHQHELFNKPFFATDHALLILQR